MRHIQSCQEYFETLPERFVADKAAGVSATYVYELTGAGGGTWTVSIENGELSVSEGAVESPSVKYTMDADKYVELANGKLSGPKAVLTRKLKVSGSIAMAKKMNDFLPPAKG